MTIFMTVILILTLIFLIYGSIWDLLFLGVPKIESNTMTVVSVLTFIVCAIKGTFIYSTIPYLIVMLFLILLPIISKKMGCGDALAYISTMLIITATSFVTGVNNFWIYIVMWFSSHILFLVYCLLTQKKGHRKLPMFPFITLGYIISLILYFNIF